MGLSVDYIKEGCDPCVFQPGAEPCDRKPPRPISHPHVIPIRIEMSDASLNGVNMNVKMNDMIHGIDELHFNQMNLHFGVNESVKGIYLQVKKGFGPKDLLFRFYHSSITCLQFDFSPSVELFEWVYLPIEIHDVSKFQIVVNENWSGKASAFLHGIRIIRFSSVELKVKKEEDFQAPRSSFTPKKFDVDTKIVGGSSFSSTPSQSSSKSGSTPAVVISRTHDQAGPTSSLSINTQFVKDGCHPRKYSSGREPAGQEPPISLSDPCLVEIDEMETNGSRDYKQRARVKEELLQTLKGIGSVDFTHLTIPFRSPSFLKGIYMCVGWNSGPVNLTITFYKDD
ncbi:hypothetical protein ADUPG1_011160, partial [Aduncisulcus paluster]